jgi:hypothetical protein
MTPNKKHAALGGIPDQRSKMQHYAVRGRDMTGVPIRDDMREETASSGAWLFGSPGISTRGSWSGPGFRRSTRRLCHGGPSGESEKADQLTGDIQSALACLRRSTWIR